MNNETNPILEKPGTTSQMENDSCHVVNLAGGVFMLEGDVLKIQERIEYLRSRPYRPIDYPLWVRDWLDMPKP